MGGKYKTNRTRGINAEYGAIRFEWGCHPHLEHLRPSEIMPCDSAELSGISALHTVIFNHAHIVLSNQELDIAWDAEQCSIVICSAIPSTVRLRGGGPLIGDTNEQAAGAPDPDHAQVCRVVPDPSPSKRATMFPIDKLDSPSALFLALRLQRTHRTRSCSRQCLVCCVT